MKKKMSRLVCALLVIAMVCAMVPAAFAHEGDHDYTDVTPVHVANTRTHEYTCKVTDCTQKETEACDASAANHTCSKCGYSYEISSLNAPAAITIKANADEAAEKAAAVAALPAKVTANVVGGNGAPAATVECSVEWDVNGASKSGSVWSFTGTVKTLPDGYFLPAAAAESGLTTVATVTTKTLPTVTVSSVVTGTTNTTASVNVGTSLTLTATPALDPTGGSGTFAYKWYKCDADGSNMFKVGKDNENLSATFKVPTATANVGDTYYRCGVTYTEDGLTTDEVFSNVIKVTVYSQYKLEIRSATADGATVSVGTDPVLRARLRVYDPSATGTDKYKDYTGTDVTYAWTHNKNATNAELDKRNDQTSGESTATLETKAADDVNGSKITVTVTAKIGGIEKATASYSFNLQPANAKDINYTSSTSGVVFSESDFYNAVQEATGGAKTSSGYYYYGEALTYVRFGNPTGGTLYTSSTSSTQVSSSNCYYDYKSSYTGIDLDAVCFVPNNTSNYHVVTYAAYNANGVIACGTVNVGATGADIEYSTIAGQSVRFDEDDFQKFFAEAYNRGSLSCVRFDTTYDKNLNTRTYGYLYESSDSKADTVSSKTDYYYEASSRQSDLDAIVFTAGSRTSKYTITIPFTAYGTKYAGGTASVNGNVVITVNDGRVVSVYSIGTSFKGDIYKAMIPENYTERDVSNYWVLFDDVTNGKLFYNYNGIASAKEVTTKTVFYFSAGRNELGLEEVYFVPSAGAQTAKVTYTIYSGNNTKIESGSINFNVIQQTKSNYFNDVTESNTGKWSANAVDFMSYNELVTGTGTKAFSPNQTMTRAMLVTILYRIEGKPSVNVSNPFNDVKNGTYYYDAVLWAYKNDIVSGVSKTSFNPSGAVTREQIAAILYRYAGKPRTTGTLSGYTDRTQVSSYAETAMAWAVKNGIITGKSATKLDPLGKATRAEVAVMLHRYLTK